MILTRYKLPIEIDALKYYNHPFDFKLESGVILKNLTLGYHSYGTLNKKKDNVIWVCHALTANSNVEDWWGGLFGKNNVLDPEKHFIICVNILGSNYGSTGPLSIDPQTDLPYGLDFPNITIKDIADANLILANALGITNIKLALGGSCGGHQVLEMCLNSNFTIQKSVLLVTCGRESSWSIAIHEAQRLALNADPSLNLTHRNAGRSGLIAARAMGLIGYRTYEQYKKDQSDKDDRTKSYRASSYIQYQGRKLADRFHAHSYFVLLNALDTHNVGRNRNSIQEALESIETECLIISIDTDILIPKKEQELLAKYIPNNSYYTIQSEYGHDGFLTETDKIKSIIREFQAKD